MPESDPRNAERAEEDEPEQKTTAHALMVETQLTPTSSSRGRCQGRTWPAGASRMKRSRYGRASSCRPASANSVARL